MMPIAPGSSSVASTSAIDPQTPVKYQAQKVGPEVIEKLENLFPGLNTEEFIGKLDNLFGGRHNYVIAGSTAMHLHAIGNPNGQYPQLPAPGDIDLVLSSEAMNCFGRMTNDDLAALGFTADPAGKQAFSVNLGEGKTPLSIDLIADKHDFFKDRCVANAVKVGGLQVRDLLSSLEGYRKSAKSEDYIAKKGGNEKALFWGQYFPEQAVQTRPIIDPVLQPFPRQLGAHIGHNHAVRRQLTFGQAGLAAQHNQPRRVIPAQENEEVRRTARRRLTFSVPTAAPTSPDHST